MLGLFRRGLFDVGNTEWEGISKMEPGSFCGWYLEKISRKPF